MRAVVVYESFFGNTRLLAEAVAEGVRTARPDLSVTTVPVHRAPDRLDDVGLLVVGGPTHFLGASSCLSRWLHAQYWGDPEGPRRARRPHGAPAARTGLRDWCARADLPPGSAAAAFDTRMRRRPAGGAARGLARRLRARGAVVVAAPEGFVVDGVRGPLRAGERERAVSWAAGLAARAGAPR